MFRLLGLLGGLSVATDLGTGAPMEESLRRCVVAARLARVVGCAEEEVGDVIYTALLQHLGCTAYAHELARDFGDDVAVTRVAFLTNFAEPTDYLRTWAPGVAAATGQARSTVLAKTLVSGTRLGTNGPAATCEVAQDAARQLRLGEAVQTGVSQTTAMWNGKGYPRVAGAEIARCARIMHVASTAVMFCLHENDERAVTEVARRSGTYLDPDLAAAFGGHAAALLDGLEDVDAYRHVLDSEPDPVRLVAQESLEAVARTFGALVDLKSPRFQGHSAAVADLAAEATALLGLGDEAPTVRVAGYVHDLGRVGVSSRIWDKAAALTATEEDAVRLHPYYTERILARVPELAAVTPLAGQHHERCDGTGYPHGALAAQLSLPSRVLACADAYRCLIEDRPGRRALSAAQAADRLRAEARSGRLDADAVSGVLTAAGHTQGARRPRPAGLSDRQVEVLRLVASGLSNREIARHLGISPRTAEHHVQDVYLRIGRSSRAGAAMYAMEHGLSGNPG